jgi:enamine deaminase RidA (YjgF/YER057c/UK114 family)
MGDQATRQTIAPPGYEVQVDVWKLAPAVVVGDWFQCSGQLGFAADGSLPADAKTQFDNVFGHVKTLLEAAGFTTSDVVEIASFHVGLQAELGTFAEARDRYFSEPYPAQTAVGVAELALPGALLEVKVTAIRGN